MNVKPTVKMAFFQNNFWGEKNAGFDVLYHNMKHGQLATKELAEFVRERVAIEETYSKSMSKLAKIASNGSPQGTFAPMWDVFRVSSDKLALCHLELMRKMNDLIRDINKYGDEQVKIHRKTKEEMVGTVEAVQALQVQSGHLQKSKESYHAKCLELDRLRKDGAPQKELEKAELKSKKAAESFALCIEKYNRVGGEFEQKMSESAQTFQDIEESHLRQMKQLIKGYSHPIEDTHVQVGQVHEEFKQNVENIGIDNLIQKFAEQKGTGKDRPALAGFEEYMTALAPEGVKKSRAKAFRLPGLGRKDKEPDFTDSAVTEALNSPLEVDDEGFVVRADSTQNGCSDEKENNFYSSDSDFDDEEPKKFHIQIRPVATSSRSNLANTDKELKATVGVLSLPPNRGVRQQVPVKRHLSRNSSTAGGRPEEGDVTSHRDGEQESLRRSTSSPDHSRLSSTVSGSDSLFGPPLESAFKSKSFDGREQLRDHSFAASEYAAFSSDSSSPENIEVFQNCLHVSQSRSLCSSPLPEPSPSLTSSSSSSPSEWAPQARDSDWGGPNRAPSPARMGQTSPLPYQQQELQQRPLHVSRGPSPISLSTQEAWPVAAAITEYVNAYFKGGQHNRCLVKITGDLTMSFPAGITRIFTANPNVPVLSFRLVNISKIDHFLPNPSLLFSDPSQSDPDTRDFWFNMQALQVYLQREAELNPQASYYNIGLIKYQVSSQDPGRAPLLLSAECQRSGTVTRVSLDYHCCPATAPSTQLTAVQVLLPLDHTATDLQCQPPATWNTEERRLLWKLSNLSPTNHSKGSGTLCASWQCLEVPRGPPPSLAVQFVGSGASLSGMDVELVGSRYRMSLVKKRFATGKYMAGCSL
ncbi:f-BAR domain only protein 1 [Cynoglossus semilaevis]|uniref:f-BAR domain only protein 1 n=1 Tax=Cynoglossus semilaevis TaxID=244447 RepID=UPI000D6271F1|nr:F-BAR domain only protein 1-like [Cynoglossus semilaevis]